MPGALSAEPVKNVLVLYSESRLLPAIVVADQRLQDAFQFRRGDPYRILSFSEFHDVTHFPGAAHEKRVVEFLRAKYANYHLHLVIAGGGGALEFLLKNRPRLFPR